jgi:hypothetical protein
MLVLGGSMQLAAAQIHTFSGTDYEQVNWPQTGVGFTTTATGAWSSIGGGGSVAASSNTAAFDSSQSFSEAFDAATYAGAGYGFTGASYFRANNGQLADGSDIVNTFTVSAAQRPTEMLFYAGNTPVAGSDTSGLKYVRWDWSSSDAATQFEVVANTASFQQITGSGTASLHWATYGSLNNTAMALVRVTNPNGITDFSIRSNRLTAAGADTIYGSAAQQADFNGLALLVAKPKQVAAPVAVPVAGVGMLFSLALGLGLVAWLGFRKNLVRD